MEETRTLGFRSSELLPRIFRVQHRRTGAVVRDHHSCWHHVRKRRRICQQLARRRWVRCCCGRRLLAVSGWHRRREEPQTDFQNSGGDGRIHGWRVWPNRRLSQLAKVWRTKNSDFQHISQGTRHAGHIFRIQRSGAADQDKEGSKLVAWAQGNWVNREKFSLHQFQIHGFQIISTLFFQVNYFPV